MATSTPFRELIIQDLITVLKTIKTPTFRTQVEDVNITRFLKSPAANMDFSDFPALFIMDGEEVLIEGTHEEIFSNFNILIVGTVRYNKDDSSSNIPSQQINLLIADVKEAIMDTTTVLWTNNNVSNVHVDNIISDEGFEETDASFTVISRMEYEYAHDDAGRLVQG